MDEAVDSQPARLLVVVAVLADRGIVDREDLAGGRIPDRHGDGVRFEEALVGLGVLGHAGTAARWREKKAIVRRQASSAASGSCPTCSGRRRPSHAVMPS
jgi:hypothetical protein